jgi:hypothetical protein
MNLSKAIIMPHDKLFDVLGSTKTCGVPMMTKRKLGMVPRISVVKLIEVTVSL